MKRQPSLTERVARGQRHALGVGRNPLAAPVPPVPAPNLVRLNEAPPIANAGPMSPGRSTPWKVIRGGQAVITAITARDVGTGDSTFQIRLNDVLVGDVITLPSGDSDVVNIQPITTAPRDTIDLECLTVGTGLGNVGGYMQLNG